MKYKSNQRAQGTAGIPKDCCQTPPSAFAPLGRYLRDGWTVWEPAAGEGLLAAGIAQAAAARGITVTVVSSEIQRGQDFFRWSPPRHWDALITNPPYSLKYQWLERCYALGRPFALLLPLETRGSKFAQRLFARYGMEELPMYGRVNFKMPVAGWQGTGANFAVSWFTWRLGLGAPVVWDVPASALAPDRQLRLMEVPA